LVSRLMTIRLRLTAAFVGAMAVVLAAVGVVLFASFRAGLDASIDRSLESQTYALQALWMQDDSGLRSGGRFLLQAGQSFAEVVVGGQVVESTPPLSGASPLLSAGQLARAQHQPLLLERVRRHRLRQPVRLFATTTGPGQNGRATIVVGAFLRSRDSTLSRLEFLLFVGGLAALVLSGLVGFLLCAAVLRTVDLMRSKAATITVDQPGRRLPLPRARDELWRLGVTLNDMLGRNEAAFARERAFVDDASHELRTPLAILRTELEVALRGDDPAAQLREALRSALEETTRVSQLVDDLLVLARADQGKLPLQPELMPALELLEDLREGFDVSAAANGREIYVSAPVDLVVHGDRAWLRQALGNLLDNALRYSIGPIYLSARETGGQVELHVTDRGDGLPAGFIERAFERFTRADEGRSSDGSGLGLSIVRSVAQAHGGDAHAANVPSGGADVWLTVPETVRTTYSPSESAPQAGR
ncbi:MAG: sensor histidine kinase, partial [Trebonia sp.]